MLSEKCLFSRKLLFVVFDVRCGDDAYKLGRQEGKKLAHLKHFSLYPPTAKSCFSSHPDFVAAKGKGFCLFESKNTFGYRNHKAEEAGLAQLFAITSISGVTSPIDRYVSASYSCSGSKISCDLVDPPEGPSDNQELHIEKDQIVNNYDAILKSFLETRRINDKQIPGVTFSGGFFGLDPSKHDFWDNTLDQDEEINDGELTGTWFADGTIILLNPKEPF